MKVKEKQEKKYIKNQITKKKKRKKKEVIGVDKFENYILYI